MSKFCYYFIKLCKKLHINKLIYKLTDFFISDNYINVYDIHRYKNDLNNYRKYINAEIRRKNNIHRCKYNIQIIVPVYNAEKSIKRCIDSILEQKTHYSFCLYIINDGSTDMSDNIIETYRKYNNVYIINQNNTGAAKARNEGIKDIYSDYLMFVDADDYIPNNSIEDLLNNAYSNNSDIVDGSYINISKKAHMEIIKSNNKISEDILDGYLWAKVFKSSCFKDYVFPVGNIFEDTMPYFMIYPKANIITTISEIVYCHQKNEIGVTSLLSRSFKGIDSYWITELLTNTIIEEKNYDANIYWNKLKKQFIMNYKRTCFLSKKIQKDIFVLEMNILKKMFTQKVNNDRLLGYIYDGNYNKYINYIKWN